MPWVWTCIALCAPPAALFLLTNGSRRSDIDDVRRLSTCRSHDGKTAGSGQHREFSVYFRSVGAAAILLVVSVLNFTSVRAFMAVDFMTVRQPQEFHAARSTVKSYLTGKVIWITGASSGLGEQLAISAAAGDTTGVILSGRREDALERVRCACEEVRPAGSVEGTIRVLPFDMVELDDLSKQVAEALRQFGRVDTLVLNAGVSSRASVEDTALDVAKQIMAVNYFGPIGLAKGLLASQGHKAANEGDTKTHFVVINTVQGKLGVAFRSSYCASKHALAGFFDCLRAETAHLGVRVTSVFPGYIRTSLSLNALTGDGSQHAKVDATTATGRDPRDVANEVWKAAAAGREEAIIADFKVKVATLLRVLSPSTLFGIMARRARKQGL